ncbi:MAG: TetR/AcrR family transcriptional regulator [Deltaproteobacteria bacterium]|nr:TetR/AcrR family transcriptional regulator [Deltaproteobacteria bacterium]
MAKISDKRQAIFNATLRLVSEHGFHGTSIAMIYKEAGVSAGSVYHYFSSKDELVVELYKELKKKIAKEVRINDDDDVPLRQKIWEAWDQIIRYEIENSIESTFLAQFSKSPYCTMEIEREVFIDYRKIMELFERGIKEMVIKRLPPMVYNTFSIDVAHSIAQKSKIGMIELTEDLKRTIVESTWEAIKM